MRLQLHTPQWFVIILTIASSRLRFEFRDKFPPFFLNKYIIELVINQTKYIVIAVMQNSVHDVICEITNNCFVHLCFMHIGEMGQYEPCDERQKFFLANFDALPKYNSTKCGPPDDECRM